MANVTCRCAQEDLAAPLPSSSIPPHRKPLSLSLPPPAIQSSITEYLKTVVPFSPMRFNCTQCLPPHIRTETHCRFLLLFRSSLLTESRADPPCLRTRNPTPRPLHLPRGTSPPCGLRFLNFRFCTGTAKNLPRAVPVTSLTQTLCLPQRM